MGNAIKFTFKGFVSIRVRMLNDILMTEVEDIMEFQIEQKKLKLIIEVDFLVPEIIKSDMKRYKQILFNLIGNAIKFTYKGTISL